MHFSLIYVRLTFFMLILGMCSMKAEIIFIEATRSETTLFSTHSVTSICKIFTKHGIIKQICRKQTEGTSIKHVNILDVAKFQYAVLYCLLPRTICVQHLICRRQRLSCTGTAGYSAFASNFVINFRSWYRKHMFRREIYTRSTILANKLLLCLNGH